MKSLELGASPSILSRQSSANTTPRQGNRRVAADDTSRKTAAALRRSLGTGSAVVPNNGSAIAGSTPLEAPMSTRANDAQSMHTNRVLPKPKHPSLCSLLCCFYAEFDIKVGPKIAYQSPDQFMEQNIRLEAKQMQKLLVRAFDKVTSRTAAEADSATEHEIQASDSQAGKSSLEDHDMSCPLSIFDSCSEYIITGSELTGNIINLSTHHIHVLTRPTMISDEKYERNSLLFCVGFVLRRNDDPRPYRSVLSKLALTLRDMEIESEFLSTNRPQIQTLLEDVLVSLNSNSSECNLLLGKADMLNLKLFRPQETLGAPVKDYDVPILLRRDWQMHSVSYCEGSRYQNRAHRVEGIVMRRSKPANF
jgi:Nitrogen permease regulator 2